MKNEEQCADQFSEFTFSYATTATSIVIKQIKADLPKPAYEEPCDPELISFCEHINTVYEEIVHWRRIYLRFPHVQ